MKSGFIGLIGRPNVGKSTLLNGLTGRKIAITSNKAQTTRNNIQGIYTDDDVQMIFVDTPGIHKPKNKLGKALNKKAYVLINDVDIIMFLVDVTETLGPGDKYILNMLKGINKPVILIINKIDKVPREDILKKIDEYKDLYNFDEIIPVSALKDINTTHLLDVLKKYLPDSIKYFDDETYTNVDTTFMISEYIREKVLELTEDEVPHSTTCIVENIEEDKNIISIGASIIVDRENLKKIIIGKNGSKIKEIGIRARKDIEELLNKKVYLDLFVKVMPKWRDRENLLKELGIKLYKDE